MIESNTILEQQSRDIKVSSDLAIAEFNRFIKLNGIRVNEHTIDDEEKRELRANKDNMIAAIEEGSLVIGDDGLPEYTPVYSDNRNPIQYRRAIGHILLAADRRKDSEAMGKVFAITADLTGEPPKRFANMMMPDVYVCVAVTSLFLAR